MAFGFANEYKKREAHNEREETVLWHTRRNFTRISIRNPIKWNDSIFILCMSEYLSKHFVCAVTYSLKGSSITLYYNWVQITWNSSLVNQSLNCFSHLCSCPIVYWNTFQCTHAYCSTQCVYAVAMCNRAQ